MPEAIGKQNQEDLKRLTCLISGDIMVDPVLASNGSSYCCFSMFDAMDYGVSMPGDGDGGGFKILGMLPSSYPWDQPAHDEPEG